MAIDPATVCVCGHEYRHHFGHGPCIHGTSSGESSVCGCVIYREAEDGENADRS